jgi:hypothetical protein
MASKPCPGPDPCTHSDEEHEAFDAGLEAGLAGAHESGPSPYEGTPYDEDWRTGCALGTLVKED